MAGEHSRSLETIYQEETLGKSVRDRRLLVQGVAEAGSGMMGWESAKGGCGERSSRRVEKFSQRQEMKDRAWTEGMEDGRKKTESGCEV